MTDQLVFRLATANDDFKIRELYKASFGRELSAERWRVFSYQCPTGLNRTSVIEDPNTGRLVGSYGLLPIRLRLNNREIKASLCTSVNTHPDYQGRGLFTRLGHYALEHEREFNTPVSIGMPNPKAYPGHMKVGWEVMCKLPFLVKHECRLRTHRCREAELFDERFDEFFSKVAENFSFIVMKDHRFMNWRVMHQPDRRYTKFVYEERTGLKGYVVLKHFDQEGYRFSHILDIQAKTEDVFHELIAAAESFAHGRDELNMWTNLHNPYHQSFQEEGFYERESKDLLIIHFNYGEREHIEEEAWWFCLADNDVY